MQKTRLGGRGDKSRLAGATTSQLPRFLPIGLDWWLAASGTFPVYPLQNQGFKHQSKCLNKVGSEKHKVGVKKQGEGVEREGYCRGLPSRV